MEQIAWCIHPSYRLAGLTVMKPEEFGRVDLTVYEATMPGFVCASEVKKPQSRTGLGFVTLRTSEGAA
jgi:hypothetical protein